MQPDPNSLSRVIQWVVEFDIAEVRRRASGLEARYPDLGRDVRASKVFARSAWKATGTGAATGLPANPLIMLPAAVVDTGIVLRMEVVAAAVVACLYNRSFFDDEFARWELFVPIFKLGSNEQFSK